MTVDLLERTWTKVGVDYNSTDSQKEKLAEYFGRLQWQEMVDGMSLPMMPGMAIKESIKQLNIPKVSHIAISNDMAPYGLYGIRGHYKNGMAEVYLVDEGTGITVLASDFYPNTEKGA